MRGVEDVTPLPVRKYGAHVPVSRDTLVACGLVAATPEEQARMDAAQVEHRRRVQAATEAWPAVVASLDAVTDPVGRAVLDLHRLDDGWCRGCEGSNNDGEPSTWPCNTVTEVAKVLGVPMAEDLWLAEQARV